MYVCVLSLHAHISKMFVAVTMTCLVIHIGVVGHPWPRYNRACCSPPCESTCTHVGISKIAQGEERNYTNTIITY